MRGAKGHPEGHYSAKGGDLHVLKCLYALKSKSAPSRYRRASPSIRPTAASRGPRSTSGP